MFEVEIEKRKENRKPNPNPKPNSTQPSAFSLSPRGPANEPAQLGPTRTRASRPHALACSHALGPAPPTSLRDGPAARTAHAQLALARPARFLRTALGSRSPRHRHVGPPRQARRLPRATAAPFARKSRRGYHLGTPSQDPRRPLFSTPRTPRCTSFHPAATPKP